MEKKKITILGATGSIGKQTLNVLEYMPELFELNYITANKNISDLEEICLKYQPLGVVIADENSYYDFIKNTSYKGKIFCGSQAVTEVASDKQNDLLLSALVGFSGVEPTLAAIKNNITIALANKETLVSAGKIIMSAAKEHETHILAVDSEHSAVLQCMVGECSESVEKIILTASGGPFRNTPLESFSEITVSQALKHPNWTMGSKITIDSATMMNKGFEVIEAYWLFDKNIDDIEVVIHPQSIIHSLVQFTDGSVKAQLGMPDMRMPISYSLTFPERLKYDFPRLNLFEIGRFDFFKPDFERYPCLNLAYESIKAGGNMPAALNAANEVCVSEFLSSKIKFTDIAKYIEKILENTNQINNPSIEDIISTDKESRVKTHLLINNN